MTVVRPDVLLSVYRSVRNNTTGATPPPALLARAIEASVETLTSTDYQTVPAILDLNQSESMKFRVDADTDVRPNDTLVITLLDGVSPWPGDLASSGGTASFTAWIVRYIPAYIPELLDDKVVYAERRLVGNAFTAPTI